MLNFVIGYPLTHTQSPLLHQLVYQQIDCAATLAAYANPDLGETVAYLKNKEAGLVAVTMPFKESILDYLESKSERVQALSAANTVINRAGHWHGDNTDVDGIAYALRDVPLKHQTILIIGAGGAARALGFYLKDKNASLYWLNRTKEHAIDLMQFAGGHLLTKTQLNDLKIDIIINTTPVGMTPNTEVKILSDYKYNVNQVIFDMVYNPLETSLIKDARKCGAHTISGLDMFVRQGIRQVELWLEKDFCNDEMIKTIKTALVKAHT